MLLLLVDVYADRWQQFVGISKFTSSVRRRRERERCGAQLLVATLLSVIAVHICVYYIIYGVLCVAPLSVALV